MYNAECRTSKVLTVLLDTRLKFHLGGTVRTGAFLEQVQRDGNVVVMRGHMQSRQRVLALNVRVDALGKQQANHLQVTVLGRYVQRREAPL